MWWLQWWADSSPSGIKYLLSQLLGALPADRLSLAIASDMSISQVTPSFQDTSIQQLQRWYKGPGPSDRWGHSKGSSEITLELAKPLRPHHSATSPSAPQSYALPFSSPVIRIFPNATPLLSPALSSPSKNLPPRNPTYSLTSGTCNVSKIIGSLPVSFNWLGLLLIYFYILKF